MKWVFILALVLGTPVLAALLRTKPRLIVPTCFLLGVSLFTVAPILWASPIAWPYWPSPVRGLYVSMVDGVAIALIAATHRARIPVSVKIAFAIYCLGLFISFFTAQAGLWPVTFYAWQVFRTALLFVAIARVSASVDGAPIALIAGQGAALMFEAVLTAYQFAHGVERPGGTYGNANYIGLSMDYVVFPAVALMLGTRRLLWPALTCVAALMVAVFGGSRATLGLMGTGLVLTVILSLVHRRTSRKYGFAGATALLLLVATPAMIWAANRRAAAVLESSDEMRSAMKLAARMIITDYPLGIGANSYVVFANSRGYNERAGVPWNAQNRVAPVHSTYYLVTAEMGFVGLFGLLAIFASFIVLGLRLMRKRLPSDNGELIPGLLATMVVVAAHISVEFVTMDFVIHSFFAISSGMLAGLAAQVRAAAGTSAAPAVRTGSLLPAT